MSAVKTVRGLDSTRRVPPRGAEHLPVKNLPAEDHWCLPQGQPLPEFALESGFLAPELLALDAHIRPLEDLGGGKRGKVRR